MADYIPIACGDYDYLEIACLDGYEIELTLRADTVAGVASGMEVRDGMEFICLLLPDGANKSIRVDGIEHMKVLTRPARFREHRFARSD